MRPCEIFLTDKEFEALFSAEVVAIIRILNEVGRQKCSECKGKCCQEVGCRLYSANFSSCPIYEIRPRECRYHFCHQIFEAAPLSKGQKELLQKPITEFLRGDREQLTRMFPSFPLFMLSPEGLASLGIKDDVEYVMKSFEEGRLTEELARSLLKSVCRRF